MSKTQVFLTVALTVTVMSLALSAVCLAQGGPTTQPGDKVTLEKVYDELMATQKMAKWAAILSGLSLVGVLWVSWSLKALAKNDVELGELITGKKAQQ